MLETTAHEHSPGPNLATVDHIGRPAEVAPAKKAILFVDDDTDLLESLRDAMHRHRHVWDTRFASGGEAALESLARDPADIVIADMQMPGMDGAALLAAVRDQYPTTIRMILSGYASPQHLTRAAAVAHRFLGKPFDVRELARLIERSCALRDLTEQAQAFRVSAAATALPSRPGVYTQIARILADPQWDPEQIAAAVEGDIAITAKVLQLANSAFFGVGRTVTSVRQAVVYLGVETIKSLTLMAEAFGKFEPGNRAGFSIEAFQQHSMLVARIAAAILPSGRAQQEAVTAGLLHDVGKLVLIADDPPRWQRLNETACREGRPLHEVEEEQDGVTHAATGAYLLTLWGLPDGVTEAVAHHHDPRRVAGAQLDSVAAVHIANALANELSQPASDEPPPGPLDEEFVDRLGLGDRQEIWRTLAARCAEHGSG